MEGEESDLRRREGEEGEGSRRVEGERARRGWRERGERSGRRVRGCRRV